MDYAATILNRLPQIRRGTGFKALLAKLNYLPPSQLEVIVEAFEFGSLAHEGQRRYSGPDGGEVFFLQGTQLMAAPVQTDASFTHQTPEVLFEAPYFFGAPGRNYDVGSDGRFLMVKTGSQPGEDAPTLDITVVLNWHQELLERVPVP